MLGRTDSRRRLLFLLLVFVVGSVALVAPAGLLAGRRPRALAGRGPCPDDGHGRDPSKRGDIYDRSGTVVLATTLQRDRLVGARRTS